MIHDTILCWLRWPELFQIIARTNGKNMTAEEVEALLYDKRNYGQVADGSTCQRIKLSRNVGELVFNPVQLIRS